MGPFAIEGFPAFVVLAVLAVMIAWLLFRSHRYLSRQDKGWSPPARGARPKPGRPVQALQPGPQLDAPDGAVRWELRMHETARDLAGQLDSKMSALGHLIQEADRAAARLEQAMEKAGDAARRGHDESEAGGARDVESPRSEPPDDLDPLPPRPSNQADALAFAGTRDRVSPGNSHAPGPSRPPADERYEEIYMLADYGFDAAEIARRVASPLGEVQLILSLRAKR
jgi:hypothetical protein